MLCASAVKDAACASVSFLPVCPSNGPHALDDDNGSMTIFTRIAAYLSPRHHLGRLN